MKMIKLSLVLLSGVMGSAAMANHHEGPCKKVVEACEAGGFVKGGHKEGKGLWKDCVANVVDGKAVPGVTVDAPTVAACKAKRAEMAEKRAEKNKK
ncbi:MAG: hypothetical protein JST16_14170 [Bdellovibrionales bacterium]|nr:hypothetical protein [Bdellovibrionales bacterium]